MPRFRATIENTGDTDLAVRVVSGLPSLDPMPLPAGESVNVFYSVAAKIEIEPAAVAAE